MAGAALPLKSNSSSRRQPRSSENPGRGACLDSLFPVPAARDRLRPMKSGARPAPSWRAMPAASRVIRRRAASVSAIALGASRAQDRGLRESRWVPPGYGHAQSPDLRSTLIIRINFGMTALTARCSNVPVLVSPSTGPWLEESLDAGVNAPVRSSFGCRGSRQGARSNSTGATVKDHDLGDDHD